MQQKKRGGALLAESEYFELIERERMGKIRSKLLHRKGVTSPLTGKPMQECTVEGLPVLVCALTGGVWLSPDTASKLLPNLLI